MSKTGTGILKTSIYPSNSQEKSKGYKSGPKEMKGQNRSMQQNGTGQRQHQMHAHWCIPKDYMFSMVVNMVKLDEPGTCGNMEYFK